VSRLLDARLCLLAYLYRSTQARSVQQILHHLLTHSSWGQDQLASHSQDQGLRTVQLWLKQLRESSEFGGFVDAVPDPANRRRLLYQASGGPMIKALMPIEEALLVALAEDHLKLVIPEELRATCLDAMFAQAHKTISQYEARLSRNQLAIGQYLKSVAVHPRGQVLVPRKSLYTEFALISSALLHKRCICMTYAGRQRLLHPCAIVVRSPKMYLIACEDTCTLPKSKSESSSSPDSDSDSDSDSARKPKVYQFQCMQSISVGTKRSNVDGFDLHRFIEEQRLEVPLLPPSGISAPANVRLVLYVYPPSTGPGDALINDLRAYPLAIDQQLTLSTDQSFHILCIDCIVPTESLAVWILGRHDRVEVISPHWLRQLIRKRIAAMQLRYCT